MNEQTMKSRFTILRYVTQLYKNRPTLFWKSLLFLQICSLFPIATGVAIKVIFEKFALGPIDNPVEWVIVIFLALLFGRIVFLFFTALNNTKGRFFSSADMRLNLLSTILKKPGAESLNLSTGDALNRIKEDVNQIEDFAFGAALDVITSFVLTLFALGILVSIDWIMTLIVFTPILLMVYIMEFSGSRVSKYRVANRLATGKVSSAIGEIFTNIQAIQINSAEESVHEHLHKLNETRAKSATKDNVFSQIMATLYENIFNIGTGMILIFMAIFNDAERFSLGTFVIFTYYMNFISFFITFAGNAFTRYKQIQVSFEHLCSLHESISLESLVAPNEFLASKPSKETPLYQLSQPLNQFCGQRLSYTYQNGRTGIEDIDFKLNKGTLTVIAGRIGSGKTTLLKVCSGLLKADEGFLYWNKEAIHNPEEFLIPPRLAYAPQIPKFFSTTIKENIQLGMTSCSKREAHAIKLSVMAQDLEGFTEGLETHIGTNGVKLSGGQQLRLAVARMCVREVDLYAFDDISSALDVETEALMWERLLEEREGTYLAVSNRKNILQKADQIILLKEGKLEAVGSLESLLECSEEMRLILDEAVNFLDATKTDAV